MTRTKAGKAVAAYGKALEKIAARSRAETPAYLRANEAKGTAYGALPRGTRAYATTKHG